MEQNSNIQAFAKELSNIIGQHIGLDHIHSANESRYYYIQKPQEGAPMLLHHYRGPFFVDIHPNDMKKLESGNISPSEYISTANWLVGYYWGGGSMIKGGYYQPFDIVNRTEEIRRYFKILSCRGSHCASGYTPTEEHCAACAVENCAFSKYKDGDWEYEMEEYDPRIDFYCKLCRRFKSEFPGYTLGGFLCTNIPDDTIILSPVCHYVEGEPFSFVAYASENVIRDLMMRKVTPVNWDEYAKQFTFRLHKLFSQEYLEATEENVKAIFTDMDFAEKNKQAETKQESNINELLSKEEDANIIAKIVHFFKRII